MTRELALKASLLLMAVEELERFADELDGVLNILEDNNNYQDLAGPIRDLVRKVIVERQRELEAL